MKSERYSSTDVLLDGLTDMWYTDGWGKGGTMKRFIRECGWDCKCPCHERGRLCGMCKR